MFFSSMVRSRLLQHTTTFLGWFLLDIVLLCSYPLTGKNFENNFCSNILWKFFQFKFFLCPHEKMSLCMYFWQQYYRSKCILASALNEGTWGWPTWLLVLLTMSSWLGKYILYIYYFSLIIHKLREVIQGSAL